MNPQKFDRMIEQLSQALSRRALVGGSLGAAVLGAVGLGNTTLAKKGKTVRTERCLAIGEKCPKTLKHGKEQVKHTCARRCCTRYSETASDGKRRCACRTDGAPCTANTARQCCSQTCSGGLCGSPGPGPAVGCDPHSGLNCVPRGEACSRGGAPCCCQDECVSDDSGGTCLAPCGAGTRRCNEGCLGFCQLGEPHAGGCDQCVCPPETTLSCTLGSEYRLSDTCCGEGTQICCLFSPTGDTNDPNTINVCCDSDSCAEPPGTGCAA